MTPPASSTELGSPIRQPRKRVIRTPADSELSEDDEIDGELFSFLRG